MKREFRLDLCEPVDRCGGGAAAAAALRIGPRSAVSVNETPAWDQPQPTAAPPQLLQQRDSSAATASMATTMSVGTAEHGAFRLSDLPPLPKPNLSEMRSQALCGNLLAIGCEESLVTVHNIDTGKEVLALPSVALT